MTVAVALEAPAATVDWLAVSWCVSGTRITHLTYPERRMVVRRLRVRMPATGKPPGLRQLSAQMIGELIGCTGDAVQKMLERLPAAVQAVCPVCRETCWRLADDVIEAHPDRLWQECPISGHVMPDEAVAQWEALTASTVLEMARALHHGETDAVWSWARWLSVGRLREMLVAALAAVDVESAWVWMDNEVTAS